MVELTTHRELGRCPAWLAGYPPPICSNTPFPKSELGGFFVTLANGLPDDSEALAICANTRLVTATLGAGQQNQFNP